MDFRRVCYGTCALLIMLWSSPSFSQEEEETYSINLTKTAEAPADVQEVEGAKVLTETHTVREGEHIWKLLREKGLLQQRNLSEVLSVLKRLNGSLTNLDLIHPGQKIVIPLKIVPVAGPAGAKQEVITPVSALKEEELENYTIKPGDTISRVAQERYHLPPETLYTEYLELVKKLNPDIEDLNTVYPGQRIRLPIYSPKVVRQRIEPPAPTRKEETKPERKEMSSIARGLETIFSRIGEDWVRTGRHFIPLKSGGQIDLSAESFPMLNLRSGERIIVDLRGELPEKMARLIEASWDNYRVVQLTKKDVTLRSAFEKVLPQCRYPRVFEKGKPLELQGEIPLSISGDWVVVLSETASQERPSLAVINLTEGETAATPLPIKDYLEEIGIRVIEYPPVEQPARQVTTSPPPLGGGGDPVLTLRTVFDLTGQRYSTQVEIPAYESEKADLKVVIKADFLLKVRGKDAIIDLSGLDERLVPFLKEHDFLILSLAGEGEPLKRLSRTLEFIGVPAETGVRTFTPFEGAGSKAIRFSLPAVVFKDQAGDPILATSKRIPDPIADFLFQKGFKLLPLTS